MLPNIKMQKFNLKKKKFGIAKTKKNKRRRIQGKRKLKRENEEAEIKVLGERLWPAPGQPKEELPPSSIKAFSDLPISKKTLKGLTEHKFITPTDIQRESLMYGLQGRDILGAAKTGSGKTLAFLIPLLEHLFRQRYTAGFGMAALVISPTRELAYQSYDLLMKIGKFHDICFGLATGGMHLGEESRRMHLANVVICTPGRLLQHLEQTADFSADELKILVIDEADKILHIGFEKTMKAIIEYLPRQRQTLMFSATQTKSVKDLAKLSLTCAVYISAHEKAEEVTPATLGQYYTVGEMQDKINNLWSFIKSHKHTKILVFLSCCKQARYIYQVFKMMRPGLTILCLHGHMKQHQRMEAYNEFSRKKHVVLLATDVASRGLDFPSINWVVQFDKPDNVDTYIHRVGRTARYEKEGNSLLLLLPSEETKMIENLTKRKIPIFKQRVNMKFQLNTIKKLESLCASDKELNDNAKKAFIAVMKTMWLLDKDSFQSVDQGRYAESLGLVQAPKLHFLEQANKKTEKKSTNNVQQDDKTETQVALQKKGTTTLNFHVDSDDEDDTFYDVIKDVKTDEAHGTKEDAEELVIIGEGHSKRKKSRAREKLKLLKYTTKIIFDEDGNPENKDDDDDDKGGLNISKAILRMKEQDKIDKELQRQKIKQQHREKRLKLKDQRRQAELQKRGRSEEEEEVVVLGSPTEDASDNEDDSNGDNEDDSNSDNEDDSNSDSEDDEPRVKRQKLSSADDASSQDASEEEIMDQESDSGDDDDENVASEVEEENGRSTDPNLIEQDEEAVLALLGGNN